MRLRAILLGGVCLISLITSATDSSDLVKKAVEQSQLTLPGSRPFHLKASVVEATNLENDEYKAQIEEFWVEPGKWRRIITSPHFTQTLIVSGGKVSATEKGDYYPNWLRTLVNAIFEPGSALEGVEMSKSSDNPEFGTSRLCRRFTFRAGIPPVGNNVFSVFCFQSGLLASVGKPGYHAEYKDYKKFGEKKVARKVREYIENGTEVEATVEELDELPNPDESRFAIQQVSPDTRTVQISEESFRALSKNSPAMAWPPVHAGKTSGVLSMYVCVDRTGHPREIYDLNSDHPDMSDAARKQVMDWTFRVAASNGTPVQVESILTFAYETRIDDPIPLLREDDARKQALHLVDPDWPANFANPGTPIILTVAITENGTPKGLTGIDTDSENRSKGLISPERLVGVLGRINEAIKEWKFKPYLQNGKQTPFDVRITFTVKSRP